MRFDPMIENTAETAEKTFKKAGGGSRRKRNEQQDGGQKAGAGAQALSRYRHSSSQAPASAYAAGPAFNVTAQEKLRLAFAPRE
jgi:hypothetical protein